MRRGGQAGTTHRPAAHRRGAEGPHGKAYPLGACVRASWVLLDRGARVRSCLTGLPIIALDGFVDPAFSNRALARLPVGLGLGFMDVILE